jgi:serine/threonine protein kinase
MTFDALLIKQIEAKMEAWEPDKRAEVEGALERRLEGEGRAMSEDEIVALLDAHSDEPDTLVELIELKAPEEFEVLGRMSQIGSQKVVYDARWKNGRPVVLKQFIEQSVQAQGHLLERELQPHPLRMTHPHIIETHVFRNADGEKFLVEKKLPDVLEDGWRAGGVAEASNLLFDIALALQYLHGRDLVHGDIKPDNLGFDEQRYVLLDFGVCRKQAQFEAGATATGSLRTRAPELLAGSTGHGFASDVFALGAVVFNSLIGAFPLLESGEVIPRVSAPEERKEKEALIRTRASEEYEHYVTERLQAGVEHEGMRKLLGRMLATDPITRPDANEVVSRAHSDLVAFIRTVGKHESISIEEQLGQLEAYLPKGDLRSALSRRRLIALRSALEGFRASELEGEREQALLANLERRVKGSEG